jgi:non-haem dioxygenase in morphine synthesis N-terminal
MLTFFEDCVFNPIRNLGTYVIKMSVASPATRRLALDSAYGPIYRDVSTNPPRQATASEIPVIDVSGIFSNKLTDRKAVALKVKSAAENAGFFYVQNHGVNDKIINEAYTYALR